MSVEKRVYRWGGFDKYDVTICVLILVFILINVCVLMEPPLETTAQGLILILVFLGGSRIVIIESNKTTKEESKK